jgi:hypothetical protein
MSTRTILACAAAVAAFAGCGGGDDGGDRRPEPEAKTPLSGELGAWNRAVAAQDCRAYAPLALTATRHATARVGGPPVADECAFYRQQLPQWRGVTLRQARDFGTAAIGQGPGPRRGSYTTWTAIFVLDWDGRYRFFGVQPSAPQIGTQPGGASDFQSTADAFVKAVRDGDCRAFIRYTMPTSSFYEGVRTPEEGCRAVFRGRNLAPQLRDDPDARPERLGETRDLAFFGVATKRNYYTLILSTKPTGGVPPEVARQLRGRPNALVLDYRPNYRPVE